jgi:hypothetical protein
MGSWILVVESNCSDPAFEKEFNEWYNNVHVPEVVSYPCFIRGIRYELVEPVENRGKYMAIYEIESESDDFDKVMANVDEFVQKKAEKGNPAIMSPLFKRTARAKYKKIYTFKK